MDSHRRPQPCYAQPTAKSSTDIQGTARRTFGPTPDYPCHLDASSSAGTSIQFTILARWHYTRLRVTSAVDGDDKAEGPQALFRELNLGLLYKQVGSERTILP
jgi:hypothetical protein